LLALEEVLIKKVHQLCFDNTLQLLPFIVTMNVLFPMVSVNFEELGTILNIWEDKT